MSAAPVLWDGEAEPHTNLDHGTILLPHNRERRPVLATNVADADGRLLP
jgi:hypothetical protein